MSEAHSEADIPKRLAALRTLLNTTSEDFAAE